MTISEINAQIATLIQAARVAKGLSQRELAKKAGISPTSLCFIERGEIHNLDKIYPLCRVLNITITISIN